jgi:hypothetical protein
MKRRRGMALRRRYGRSAKAGNTVPALDALGEEGLMFFWSVYHRAGPRLAQHLFGEKFPKFTNAASSLASYASNKATALACAKRGDDQGADMYNGIADRIAQKLPARARDIVLPEQTLEAIRNAITGERMQTERAILKGWKR